MPVKKIDKKSKLLREIKIGDVGRAPNIMRKMYVEKKINFEEALGFGVYRNIVNENIELIKDPAFSKQEQCLRVFYSINLQFQKECSLRIRNIIYKTMRNKKDKLKYLDSIIHENAHSLLSGQDGYFPESVAHKVALKMCNKYKLELSEFCTRRGKTGETHQVFSELKTSRRKTDLSTHFKNTIQMYEDMKKYEKSNKVIFGELPLHWVEDKKDIEYKPPTQQGKAVVV